MSDTAWDGMTNRVRTEWLRSVVEDERLKIKKLRRRVSELEGKAKAKRPTSKKKPEGVTRASLKLSKLITAVAEEVRHALKKFGDDEFDEALDLLAEARLKIDEVGS